MNNMRIVYISLFNLLNGGLHKSRLHHVTSLFVDQWLAEALHASKDYSNIWHTAILRTAGDIYVWHPKFHKHPSLYVVLSRLCDC